MISVKLKNLAADSVVKALNNMLEIDMEKLGMKRTLELSDLAETVEEKRASLRKVMLQFQSRIDANDPKTKEEFDALLEIPVDVKPLSFNIFDGLNSISGADIHALRPLVLESPALSVVH